VAPQTLFLEWHRRLVKRYAAPQEG
jgi:hypothetical protein